MSAIRAEIINYVNRLPEYKLAALRPMFEMIAEDDEMFIEKVEFRDLGEDEKQSILRGRNEATYFYDEIDWDNLSIAAEALHKEPE